MKKIGTLLLAVLLSCCSISMIGIAKENDYFTAREKGTARFTYTYLAYGTLTKNSTGLSATFYLDGHSDVTKINITAKVTKDGKEVNSWNKTVYSTSLTYSDSLDTSKYGKGTYEMSGIFTVYGDDGGSEKINVSDSIVY